MKKRTSVLRVLLCALLICGVFLNGSLHASAISTVYMVPPIDKDYVHHNTLYLSPNYNISAQEWGFGTTVDILNTTGDIDGLVAEVIANVTPSGGERIMGIYMEGSALSGSAAAAIVGAGWTKVEMYYDTYMVSCLPAGGTYPNVQLATNETIDLVLRNAGFTDEYALLEVTGVNSSWAFLGKYDPSFSFLSGTDLHTYKYQSDLAVFLEVEETYIDSYDTNFLEWHNPQLVDPEINGFYVSVGQALPDTVVCTPDEAAEMRANPPVVANTQGDVLWKMIPGLIPENFTAEAVVTPSSETEVSVAFDYSGALPEGTEVTVQIPQETVSYTEGTQLYLYYCNPDTQLREFVSSGTYTQQQVTFAIYHCSEYVITSEDHGESYLPEPEEKEEPEADTDTEPVITVGATTTEPETTQDSVTVDTSATVEPQTNGTLWIAIAAGAAIIIAGIVILLVRKKKKA